MLILRILTGELAGREIPVGQFPFAIGRSPGSALASEDLGVWDHHAVIELHRGEGFSVTAVGEASLLLNGEPQKLGRLRNGDVIRLGALAVQCWLSPATQKGLLWGEGVSWGLIFAVLALQAYLVHRLLIAG